MQLLTFLLLLFLTKGVLGWSIFYSLESICTEKCRDNGKPFGRLLGNTCSCYCPVTNPPSDNDPCDDTIGPSCQRFCQFEGYSGGDCVAGGICWCFCRVKDPYTLITTTTPDPTNNTTNGGVIIINGTTTEASNSTTTVTTLDGLTNETTTDTSNSTTTTVPTTDEDITNGTTTESSNSTTITEIPVEDGGGLGVIDIGQNDTVTEIPSTTTSAPATNVSEEIVTDSSNSTVFDNITTELPPVTNTVECNSSLTTTVTVNSTDSILLMLDLDLSTPSDIIGTTTDVENLVDFSTNLENSSIGGMLAENFETSTTVYLAYSEIESGYPLDSSIILNPEDSIIEAQIHTDLNSSTELGILELSLSTENVPESNNGSEPHVSKIIFGNLVLELSSTKRPLSGRPEPITSHTLNWSWTTLPKKFLKGFIGFLQT